MADVFISYAHTDADIAAAVAAGLEARGYSTWRYQEKSKLGGSYLKRIGTEIRECRAALFVVSAASLASTQCEAELVRAHELGKSLLPLRRGITHDELVGASETWAMALKGAVTAEVTPETASAMAEEAASVLHEQKIDPGAPVEKASPLRRLSRGTIGGSAAVPLRAVVAGVVGVLGVPYTLHHLGRALSPGADAEGWVLSHFGGFRVATVLVNGAGVLQNALLLYGAWLLYRRQARGAPLLRGVSLSMLVTIGVWLLVALASFSGTSVPNGSALSGGAITAALVAGIPSGIVFALFRRG